MDLNIIKAQEHHAQKIYYIMDVTDKEVNDRNIFVADTPEYIKSRIDSDQGFTILALCDQKPAGFLTIDLPGENEKNLGYDLSYSLDEIKQSAHIDTVCVLPEYRGMGIQKKLISEGEQILKEKGYKNALGTVYPENMPSLQSFLALGYKIGVTKEKYGGVLRHVLYKQL